MNGLKMILDGFGIAVADFFTIGVMIAFLAGTLNGMVFGLIPGLSGSLGIALMIPFTYGMNGSSAIVLFCAALSGQTFAGSLSAILINTPGTSPNAATCFDGYPLTKQGRGAFAIGISATSSALGTIFGILVLLTALPFIRAIILQFSFPEFTMMAVLGLAAIAISSTGNRLLGLVSGLFGVLLSFVGFAPVGGELRYVFGQTWLVTGISLLPVLIGLFAVAEAITMVNAKRSAQTEDAQGEGSLTRYDLDWKRQPMEGVLYTLKHLPLVARSAGIGTALGIVPAVGGTVASFMAYFSAKSSIKGNTFGEGDPRGVIAPESANDAKDAGSALPSLAFGIPGSTEWAIILGAMVIHGVQPGPRLIAENPHIVWLAIFAISLASFASSGLGIVLATQVAKIAGINSQLLGPAIIALGVAGAFALRGLLVDAGVAIVFGILAHFMRRAQMPVVPLILGLLLGSRTERSFQQTVLTFDSYTTFFRRPISLVLCLLTIWIIIIALRSGDEESSQTGGAIDASALRSEQRSGLTLCAMVFAMSLYAVLTALDFNDTSRPAPTLVGICLLALTALAAFRIWARGAKREIVALVPSLVGEQTSTARAVESAGSSFGAASHSASLTMNRPQGVSPKLVIGSLVALYGLAHLVGLNVALALYIAAMRIAFSGQSVLRSIVNALVAVAVLTAVFNWWLNVPFTGGSLLPYRIFL